MQISYINDKDCRRRATLEQQLAQMEAAADAPEPEAAPRTDAAERLEHAAFPEQASALQSAMRPAAPPPVDALAPPPDQVCELYKQRMDTGKPLFQEEKPISSV